MVGGTMQNTFRHYTLDAWGSNLYLLNLLEIGVGYKRCPFEDWGLRRPSPYKYYKVRVSFGVKACFMQDYSSIIYWLILVPSLLKWYSFLVWAREFSSVTKTLRFLIASLMVSLILSLIVSSIAPVRASSRVPLLYLIPSSLLRSIVFAGAWSVIKR